MKILKMKQGSDEWIQARLGIPTASRFNKIITAGGQLSKSSNDYMYELIAESVIGQPCDSSKSSFMDRGTELEQDAVDLYEFENDIDVDRVGFCLRDDGLVGCSPDGLINKDGGLEIKCPGAKNHIKYLLGDIAKEYKLQIQGGLLIAEREWWDVMSYNPVMPSKAVRVFRDDPFIKLLSDALDKFLDQLSEAKEKINSMKVVEVPIEGWPFDEPKQNEGTKK